jgi:hypothetical protein
VELGLGATRTTHGVSFPHMSLAYGDVWPYFALFSWVSGRTIPFSHGPVKYRSHTCFLDVWRRVAILCLVFMGFPGGVPWAMFPVNFHENQYSTSGSLQVTIRSTVCNDPIVRIIVSYM